MRSTSQRLGTGMLDPHSTHKLVVAHADQTARTQLARELDLEGYDVHEANRFSNAVEALSRVEPDAVLLGPLEQPSMSPRLLRALRAGQLERVASAVPVITFGATDAVAEIRAYEDGSDHHVSLEISYATLRVIVAAVLRRTTAPAPVARRRFEVGALIVDLSSRQVSIGGAPVELRPLEFELLSALASDPERVFTKKELLQSIWGYPDPRSTRTLDSHACRLRRQLADHGQAFVANRWGVGYRLLP